MVRLAKILGSFIQGDDDFVVTFVVNITPRIVALVLLGYIILDSCFSMVDNSLKILSKTLPSQMTVSRNIGASCAIPLSS